ncbi:putative Polar-differentiation response regulator divK [Desulfamplus magnetovallimortis]|uniref:Putative Polar-differentiation response regulator divK n=1 Tax=Desulfamplus magnetovallimortis TaxID=1246637 RepID=A0A1W1HHK3_9BACT|nr:response regulator [Desulfamplus magnetovallimortis]SLM31926.1 putative Polar-differentiation response regulator divK [Desulfamplus magnetovallimortis]
MKLPKIMLVDDDPDITFMLKIKLEKSKKFKVIFTNKGKEALKMARNEKPDLIICDIDMPDVTGGDVARELSDCNDTRNIPFLFLSSLLSKKEAGEKCKIIGGYKMMSKSASVNSLIEQIELILNQ